ncbi:MAG: S8 family peptidase [Nevskiales bacterium]
MRLALTVSLTLAVLCAACATAPELRSPAASAAREDPQRQVVVTVHNPPTAVVRGGGAYGKRGGRGRGYSAANAARRAVSELSRDYRLTPVEVWPIELLRVYCVVFQLAADQSRDELLRMLAVDPRVESAQPMQTFSTLGSDYDDPYSEFQYSVAKLQLAQAHRWAQGRGVRVALIDTGVDLQHPDLSGRIGAYDDFVRSSDDDFHDDLHGTAVAGVIAASSNNAKGIVGVAPRAEILAFKACRPLARGSAQCSSFTLAVALAAAVARGSQVINLSLSGPPDPLLERLLRAALARGVQVVGAMPEAAADHRLFPTSVEGVLAVGIAGRAGTGAQHRLFAPGLDILTTAPNSGYAFRSGSSMAAAHVTGVVALLLEVQPDLSAQELTRLLTEASATPVAAGIGKVASAAESVSACKALARLLAAGSCADVKSAVALALKESV